MHSAEHTVRLASLALCSNFGHCAIKEGVNGNLMHMEQKKCPVSKATKKIGFRNKRLFLSVCRQTISLKHFIPIEKIGLNGYFCISLRQQGQLTFSCTYFVLDV